jgi:hypothetical protein
MRENFVSKKQMEKYLEETEILDYSNKNIRHLIIKEKWLKLEVEHRVGAIYNYVRDQIKFGYNTSDNIKGSTVLNDGYGQCNTKSTLLMTLLRGVGIPNRIHGFTIDKALQKGAITGIWYKIAPQNILHSWVEVFIDKQWYFLEGVILDDTYLKAVQFKNQQVLGEFCGYGIYTKQLQNPLIDWNKNHTFIQSMGINNDFGIFNSPDVFYKKHHQKLGWFKRFFFQNGIRHIMNRNVNQIRKLYGQG